MRILVIGGTQFIGPFVVRRLDRMGHDVTIFHRGQNEADLPERVRHIHGARAGMSDFATEFRTLAPEIVLDMRAMTGYDAQATIDAVRGIARRLIAISSMDVYHAFGVLTGFEDGDIEPMPITEDSPVRTKLYLYREGGGSPRLPDNEHYDKLDVERLVLGQSDLAGTVLRLPVVYGPGDAQHRLWPYLKRIDDGRPAILLDEVVARRRFARSYVDNVAAAVALAVTDDRAAGRIYNVSEPEALTELDWVQLIVKQTGWSGQIRILPAEQLPEHLRSSGNPAQDMAADSSRIRSELGFREEIALDDALAQTIAWERSSPPSSGPTVEEYAAEDDVLARL
ncbi:MAG TPA: NAD-dependent epimerase/dehydratase family protein [Nitrolancea sp.]